MVPIAPSPRSITTSPPCRCGPRCGTSCGRGCDSSRCAAAAAEAAAWFALWATTALPGLLQLVIATLDRACLGQLPAEATRRHCPEPASRCSRTLFARVQTSRPPMWPFPGQRPARKRTTGTRTGAEEGWWGVVMNKQGWGGVVMSRVDLPCKQTGRSISVSSGQLEAWLSASASTDGPARTQLPLALDSPAAAVRMQGSTSCILPVSAAAAAARWLQQRQGPASLPSL